VLVLQTFGYTIQDHIEASFKMPIFNIFDTPNGFSTLSADGTLVLNQKEQYMYGAMRREIGFKEFNMAETLLQSGILSIFNKI